MKCLQHFLQDITMDNRDKIITLFMSGVTPQEVLDDFDTWSGGFEPEECDFDKMDEYVHFAMAGSLCDYIDTWEELYYYVYGKEY